MFSRYLWPTVHLVFMRIFLHANLLKDFLNAVLPLDAPIESLSYLSPEQSPKIPGMQFSVIDAKCIDENGQAFIVQMQTLWTNFYFSRIRFDEVQATIAQEYSSASYDASFPVYSVTALHDDFKQAPSSKQRCLHHYKIIKSADTDKVLQGLQFVILELPKVTPQITTEKPETALWLRFLRETGDRGFTPDHFFLSHAPVADALKLTEFRGYSVAQIYEYQRNVDAMRTEKTLLFSAKTEGKIEGLAEGIEQGIEKGKLEVARNMLPFFDDSTLAQATGLPVSAIKKLGDEF